MSILFAHERASFTGGVEQNIADTVCALRSRSVPCHLAYSPSQATQSRFLDLFDSATPCNDLSAGATILDTPTLGELAVRTGARCVYFHKTPAVPDSVLTMRIRTVQMVHDHDLCCPRRHKYFAHNTRICTEPIGLRCYLDAAFLVRDRNAKLGFRYESIAAKRDEVLRRRRLDLSLVASEFMQHELLINGFPRENVKVLPLAVRTAAERVTALPSGTPTVLYVGQLIRGKGVDLLLRALALVKVPFRAVIVGQGNAEASLHKLSRELGLDHSVEFSGWVHNEDLPRYYALADLLAVPSRWPEPFGMVGLEAMRHSKPVVAFDVGGIPDWLTHGKTGLLVPPADIRKFAAALETLLSDRKKAADFGTAGAREIQKSFGFEAYISALHSLLLPEPTAPADDAEGAMVAA